MKILVAGEINPDLILEGYRAFPELGKEVLVNDSSLVLGSASAICAAGLAKLGNQVAFFGKVGCDMWGEFCLRTMERAGIDVSRVIRDPALKTGLTVSITGAKDRALVTHLGAIVALTGEDVNDGVLEGFSHIHVSSYFLQEGMRGGCRALFHRASARSMTTSLDPGFDPSERWDGDLLETLREVDVFLPNEVELRGAGRSEDPAEALRFLQNGRTLAVAKLGRSGAITLKDGAAVHVPAFPVHPVDTTGAGDSFNAGFLHRWLQRRPVEDALRFGAACGALSTLGLGGIGSQPTEEEAERFLAAHQQEA